jgi:hypothetical protein
MHIPDGHHLLWMALPAALSLASGRSVLAPARLDGPKLVASLRTPSVVGVSKEGLPTSGTFLLRTPAATAPVLWLAVAHCAGAHCV